MKAKYRLAQVIGARINRVRSGMPALKERFLSIIRTKLGTEKIAVRSLAKIRRSPRLYGTADCSQRVEPFHVSLRASDPSPNRKSGNKWPMFASSWRESLFAV